MSGVLKYVFIGLSLTGNFCLAQKIEGNPEHHFFNDLTNPSNAGYWMNQHTRKQDAQHPDNFFSATDADKPYGLGLESEIPGDLKKKNIYLFIQVQLRIADTTQAIILVTDISHGDSNVVWRGVNVAAKFGKVNEWVTVRDSLLIPSNIPPDSKMKVYVWNQDGKAEADIDDLDIHLSIPKMPSFLIY